MQGLEAGGAFSMSTTVSRVRAGLTWFGVISLIVGGLLIAANVFLSFKGLSTSYNIGDQSKDQFLLISFWHIGAVLALIGAGAAYAGRRK
jgi:hypothetical protein